MATPSRMKKKIWLILAALALVLVYLTRTFQVIEKPSPELFMLDTLDTGFSIMLDSGQPLPTNWASFTNSSEPVEFFERAQGICKYNRLQPPEAMYTLLPHKVANPSVGKWGGGFIFMVRSKQCRKGLGYGRWVSIYGADTQMGAQSNYVPRTWWPEKYLPPEVRSQVGN